MANWYVTRDDLKSSVNVSDALLDAEVDAVLEAVSRQIDLYCARQFWPVVATRHYSPISSQRLLVDDLLSVSAVTLDLDWDRVYETALDSSSYDLLPFNAAQESPPAPYTRLEIRPLTSLAFWSGPRAVEIAGTWGYYDVRETVGTTLAEDLDDSETAMDVADGTAVAVGQTLWIDSEAMFVSDVAANTLTVTRGANGTTAATHANGASLQRQTYPVISRAALLQGARLLQRRLAPLGVIESPSMAPMRVSAALDPDVRVLLAPFRRAVLA
jgi:hypothetical protein